MNFELKFMQNGFIISMYFINGEQKMNVFDFDKTIYVNDSTADFIKFCMKRHKKALLYLPGIGFAALKFYAFHIGDKTAFKERMYSFLKACDTERDAAEFWESRIGGIKEFYRQINKPDDVIISASPEFLLKPLEAEFGFTVIASKVDPHTGKYTGKNCYNAEKVNRFNELYAGCEIDDFYSDSYSDEPLARLAKRAYIVSGEDISPWDFTKHKKNIRI